MTTRATRPTALVTGASRGIGRAIALDLARTHRVIAGARTDAALDGLRADVPDLVPFICELSDEAETAAALKALSLTSLDVLVHSAGIADERRMDAFTRADWRRSFEINVFAVADVTRALLPAIREAAGTIVFLNSGSGLFSYPGGAVYSGTKFALRTLADCLRDEERATGVRIVSVHPGFVDTDMARQIHDAAGEHRADRTYMSAETIAAGVRVAVDAPPEAQFEMMSIRPSFRE